MKKEKQKTLKQLQEELLTLVEEKLYNKDEEVRACVDNIKKKSNELKMRAEKRKEKKQEVKGTATENIFVKIKLGILKFCHKLLVKEKVTNQMMGYQSNENIEEMEQEVFTTITKNIK